MNRSDRRKILRAFDLYKRAMYALAVAGVAYILLVVGNADYMAAVGKYFSMLETTKQLIIGALLATPGAWLLCIDSMIHDAKEDK